MVDNGCHSDEIYDHLRDKPLGKSEGGVSMLG